MGKSINVEVSDDEYDELSRFKDKHGLTWRGVLLYPINRRDGDDG